MITLNTTTRQNTVLIVILLAINLATNSKTLLVIGLNASGEQKQDFFKVEYIDNGTIKLGGSLDLA